MLISLGAQHEHDWNVLAQVQPNFGESTDGDQMRFHAGPESVNLAGLPGATQVAGLPSTPAAPDYTQSNTQLTKQESDRAAPTYAQEASSSQEGNIGLPDALDDSFGYIEEDLDFSKYLTGFKDVETGASSSE